MDEAGTLLSRVENQATFTKKLLAEGTLLANRAGIGELAHRKAGQRVWVGLALSFNQPVGKYSPNAR